MKPEDRPPPSESKKPYKAPKLVHLGSVRELTATGGGSLQDHVLPTTKKKVVM